MFDRRKLTLFLVAGVLGLALIITAIVVVVANQQGSSQSEAPQEPSSSASSDSQDSNAVGDEGTSSSDSPSDSAGDEQFGDDQPTEAEVALGIYEDDFEQMALNVAVRASSWDGVLAPETRVERYRQVGMSEELAQSYLPVWAEVFEGHEISEVTTSPKSSPRVDEVRGVEGSYVWRVAVDVVCKPIWHANGKTRMTNARIATWWITIDQAQGEVIAIDQPSAESFQIDVEGKN